MWKMYTNLFYGERISFCLLCFVRDAARLKKESKELAFGVTSTP